MGKRKHNSSESDSEIDEYIAKKLKKLTKKLHKRKNKRSERDHRRRSKSPSKHAREDRTQDEGSRGSSAENNCIPNPERERVHDEVPSKEIVLSQNKETSEENTQNEQDAIEPPAPELDSTILEILGDDPSIIKEYGKEIQADLAIRFQHVAINGLSKEIRKELQDKYLPPSNCAVIDAPALNPEIKAAVSEVVLKRDKGIELKQKELCAAISCIGEALTLLISKEEKDTSVIKLLMDASRLMCDCQNADSVTRRNFVLYNVKKEMKDQLQKTKIDKNLFGSDLSETLKTAKLISKSGAELKSAPTSANKSAAKNKPVPGTSTQQSRNNLNWKAPPPSRRQKGTQRMKEPASRNQHASYSRSSQRAPASSRSRR